MALVALSHFFLDGLVHVAGLPLAGENSLKLGLGLWNHLPLELSLETAMATTGLLIYWLLASSRASRIARYGVAAFVLLVTAMTWTQLGLTTPPTAKALTISWILIPIVFSGIIYALDRPRSRAVVQSLSLEVPIR